MATNTIVFKTPDEVAKEYLQHLKGLKPEVNTHQTDSDWWVKAQAIGGLMSGVYGDQKKLSQDPFPQNARRDALAQHLDLYFGSGFNPATPSVGDVGVTGLIGSTVSVNAQILEPITGNTYQATDTVQLNDAISATLASGDVPFQSVAAGQDQNLLAGADFVFSSPPTGVNPAAVALIDFKNGRDAESLDEARARVLKRIRFPLAGGTKTDYEQWATDADPSVVNSNIIRFVFGPGTVGVVITAGTTNIDNALNRGEPVIRIPSQTLIDKVAAYIDAKNPLTDCSFVFAPNEITANVTARVRFRDGDINTIPATQLNNPDGTKQTLTQGELVVREIKRAIYKTPPGGRQLGSKGYLLSSEIEQVIDLNLSSEPYVIGAISQILTDRQVDDLAASGPDLEILPNQIVAPGVINVIEVTG